MCAVCLKNLSSFPGGDSFSGASQLVYVLLEEEYLCLSAEDCSCVFAAAKNYSVHVYLYEYLFIMRAHACKGKLAMCEILCLVGCL